MPLDAAVVVALFNRLDAALRLLDTLAKQTHPADRFEVVFTNDSGPEGYTPYRQAFAARRWPFRFRYFETGLPRDVYGVTVAENLGARLADAPLIMTLGDDSLPHPKWIEVHVAEQAKEDRLLLTGNRDDRIEVLDQPLPIAVTREKCVHELEKSRAGKLGAGDFKTGNASVKRKHLEAVGWFNEALAQAGAYGYTDRELGMRLMAYGMTFRFTPDAVVYHPPADPPQEADFAYKREAAQAAGRKNFHRVRRAFGWARWKSGFASMLGIPRAVFPWPGTTVHTDRILAGLSEAQRQRGLVSPG